MYGPENDPFFYFGPSWHVDRGLIIDEVIADLKNNEKSVLSVGSGRFAHFEKFLVDYCGIDRRKVILSDARGKFPERFGGYCFDFRNE